MSPTEILLKVYGELRRYVENEDRLIHERIGRMLFVHGFLLATFALLLGAKINGLSQYFSRHMDSPGSQSIPLPLPILGSILISDIMLIVVAMIGIMTSLNAVRSVKAAEIAIKSLKIEWETVWKHKWKDVTGLPELPSLTSGYRDKDKTPDEIKQIAQRSRKLPVFLVWMWAVVLLISLTSLIAWHGSKLPIGSF